MCSILVAPSPGNDCFHDGAELLAAAFRARRRPRAGVARSSVGRQRRNWPLSPSRAAPRMHLVLDTGPLLAALDAADPDHAACAALLEEAMEDLVVPSLVLAELRGTPVAAYQGQPQPSSRPPFVTSRRRGPPWRRERSGCTATRCGRSWPWGWRRTCGNSSAVCTGRCPLSRCTPSAQSSVETRAPGRLPGRAPPPRGARRCCSAASGSAAPRRRRIHVEALLVLLSTGVLSALGRRRPGASASRRRQGRTPRSTGRPRSRPAACRRSRRC